MQSPTADTRRVDEAMWRLGRRPGLDGLRGIAILLVLAGHVLDVRALRPLGQNGVVVFFVLSGFLITSLLLEELQTRIGLTHFYLRRVRRLAPALLVVVGFVAVVRLFAGQWWTTPRALIGALTWSTNWIAPSTTQGEALAHFWSLAIEEQFYMVWPLTIVALTRFPWAVQRATMVVAVSFTTVLPLLLLGAGPWHVYYGTDTRSLPLLAGCLLAMTMSRRPEGPGSATGALVGVVLLVVISVAWRDQFLAGWIAPQVVTFLTVGILWCSSQCARAPVLTGRPLRYVGRRSYALYLWHPIVLVLLRHYTDLDANLRALVILATSFVLAEFSWRHIERPFARRRSSAETMSDALRLHTAQRGR